VGKIEGSFKIPRLGLIRASEGTPTTKDSQGTDPGDWGQVAGRGEKVSSADVAWRETLPCGKSRITERCGRGAFGSNSKGWEGGVRMETVEPGGESSLHL